MNFTIAGIKGLSTPPHEPGLIPGKIWSYCDGSVDADHDGWLLHAYLESTSIHYSWKFFPSFWKISSHLFQDHSVFRMLQERGGYQLHLFLCSLNPYLAGQWILVPLAHQTSSSGCTRCHSILCFTSSISRSIRLFSQRYIILPAANKMHRFVSTTWLARPLYETYSRRQASHVWYSSMVGNTKPISLTSPTVGSGECSMRAFMVCATSRSMEVCWHAWLVQGLPANEACRHRGGMVVAPFCHLSSSSSTHRQSREHN